MLDTTRKPTEEQAHILDLMKDKDNLQINSFAGTGKTSMLEMIEERLEIPVMCLAFNKSTKLEMEKRFKKSSECFTLNSLGHRTWGRACAANIAFTINKAREQLATIIQEMPKRSQGEAWDVFNDVLEAQAMAKALGYVPKGVANHVQGLCDWEAVASRCDGEPSELVYSLCNRLLTASIKSAYQGVIDFNDQIYMPALFGGTFPKFPLVMVDERQDLSPTNVQMLKKLVRGRLVEVGDPHQSIYGFRGAEQDGMARGKVHFNMVETYLSISFRCPSEIVKNVRWKVPQFRWFKEGGRVVHLSQLEPADIHEGSAIICRNNAPLFRLAFHLLSNGRAVTVAGSDIGPKLINILKKFGDQSMDRSAVLDRIEAWRDDKIAKGSSTAGDMADAMQIFTNYGNNLGQIIQAVKDLLDQQGPITLTTGHKAKGLEWDTVYHLDPGLIRQGGQEDNLKYVIDTRAKKELYYINSESIL